MCVLFLSLYWKSRPFYSVEGIKCIHDSSRCRYQSYLANTFCSVRANLVFFFDAYYLKFRHFISSENTQVFKPEAYRTAVFQRQVLSEGIAHSHVKSSLYLAFKKHAVH